MTQKEKVIQIAQDEIGYQEESDGLSKYGQWYEDHIAKVAGFARADWCNMFLTWVFYQAGAMDGSVYPNTSPQGSACSYCLGWFEKKGCRTDADDMPQPGDIVFYRWNANTSYIDHVGLVEKVKGSSADNAEMTVIEGNKNHSVSRRVIAYRAAEVIASVRPPYKSQDIVDNPSGADTVSAPFELSQGAEGAEVKILQMGLVLHGYSVGSDGMDGRLGSATTKAIRTFQSDHGLTEDGIVGTQTWRALFGV